MVTRHIGFRILATKKKRSSHLLSAEAPFRRLGSVLRGTKRPSELHLCQLHCETLPSGLRRSSQRLAAVPRRASRIYSYKKQESFCFERFLLFISHLFPDVCYLGVDKLAFN